MTRWIDEKLYSAFRVRLEVEHVLFEDQTDHQHLVIFENPVFGRCMMLDGVTQLTTGDEFIYHEMMAHMPLFALENPRNILIIGGGDGGLAREVLKHESVENVTMCEIDAGVVEMCQHYFPEVSNGVYNDPRLELVIADGVEFVQKSQRKYDAILIDSTDPIGPGKVLFTPKFYKACHQIMTPEAVLVTQNGVPFMQGDELSNSVSAFKEIYHDAWAFIAPTPTYIGGFMAYGWASNTLNLRFKPIDKVSKKYESLKLQTRYFSPEIFKAAFSLPVYIREIVENARPVNPAKPLNDA